LKQRNANTKQVLIKQKKLNEQLEREILKKKDAEKKVQKAERWEQQRFGLDICFCFSLFIDTHVKQSHLIMDKFFGETS